MIKAAPWRWLAALLIIFAVATGCENDEAEIEALTNDRVMVDEAVKVETLLSQGGAIKAKLTAPLMYRYYHDSVYTEFPNTLHVDFYSDSTKSDSTFIETTVDAKYGKYFESQNKVYLRDSVRVISTNGDTLLAPELWWDQNSEKFYTDKPVRYLTPTRQMFPEKGLDAGQDLKWVTFHKVHGGSLIENDDPNF